MIKLWGEMMWRGSKVNFKQTENSKIVAYEDKFNFETGEFETCSDALGQIAYMISDKVDRYY